MCQYHILAGGRISASSFGFLLYTEFAEAGDQYVFAGFQGGFDNFKHDFDGFEGFFLGEANLFYHGVDNARFGECAFLGHWDLLSRGGFYIAVRD
jgi:hypothetical protein